ncbi:succinate dehydrogenase assembly factor 2 [Yoonia sp.]|uniref:succinate dehydrogenase assembly factor 2 n=1 Tax=Yoonia sp. TaxID=2212373 RepID=UPI00236F2E46|nr:succinate dehydrogenase assembly factor 2 [Yoonia sp.]MDB4111993.1 succinate dehydrogenase assembly factor 2 [Yoonia sp.]MDC1399590.1 succinate dehydrogenase assembly factor 2 [Yoonia sp.]
MTEDRETMIKRLRMRSMRRGIKEMDLILQAFADANLAGFTDDALVLYDQLLSENDHDIYGWVGGQFAVPEEYLDLVSQIADGAQGVTKPA